ncbi:hypothetical protein [Rhizobium ruizarguesonis]|uniref:hypothetical protein n=1 Tax=Rhizobium ruizarguesonis TaxID=2081791 RepID=UPI0010327092|nr:hypothetical protein [Rhizobium ruizarguesonis]TBD22977.1 hypothetical protein ELH23_19850 [Rhizobium ruizarguesonis]
MTTPKTLPMAQPDISCPATDTEKLTVLTRLLAAYPGRTPSDFRLVRPAYMQALEGVNQWALFEAERRINQNALGHGFMPSPSELRGQINRVMEPILERERRAAIEARRYRWPEDKSPPPDEAARARIAECNRKFQCWHEANRADFPRAQHPPPRPPKQISDYSHEPVEITDALRRTLKEKAASA